MLPAQQRLRARREFDFVVRHGRRSGSRTLVAHLARDPHDHRPARAGFVVGRAVGGAVVRNRVRRRLRELVRPRLATLGAGTLLVIRALPGAAEVDGSILARDLDAVLSRMIRGGETGSRS